MSEKGMDVVLETVLNGSDAELVNCHEVIRGALLDRGLMIEVACRLCGKPIRATSHNAVCPDHNKVTPLDAPTTPVPDMVVQLEGVGSQLYARTSLGKIFLMHRDKKDWIEIPSPVKGYMG